MSVATSVMPAATATANPTTAITVTEDGWPVMPPVNRSRPQDSPTPGLSAPVLGLQQVISLLITSRLAAMAAPEDWRPLRLAPLRRPLGPTRIPGTTLRGCP